MTAAERKTKCEKLNLCFNCLAFNHRLVACQSVRNCFTCGGRHHTLLHLPKSTENVSPKTSNHVVFGTFIERNGYSGKCTQRIIKSSFNVSSILLATAIVHVRFAANKLTPLRALIDPGSQATLITERAVQLLQLQKKNTTCIINGVGSNNGETSTKCVHIDLHSRFEPLFHANTCAFVLTKVTNILPPDRITIQNWSHIESIVLADPSYATPGHIDLLLGADIYEDIIRLGLRRGERGQPFAQLTAFGWILSGKINKEQSINTHLVSYHADIETNALLQKFYEIEDVNQTRTMSAEDQWTENFFIQTHRREESGKYITRLPFKRQFEPKAVLGRSYNMALNRFHALERRLHRDPQLHTAYSNCINEYLKLGQMELVTSTEDKHRSGDSYNCCYLPHYAVVKESSSTTKVRVVFDASAKTSNGNSLNDILTTGQPLQTDLVSVIMNWRFLRFVFIADIEKMYRRIGVHPDDAEFQRILWRPTPTDDIQSYKLKTVTFGTVSAPYTAIRVVHQLANDEASRFPLAVDVLKHQMYVDDALSGGHTIHATKLLQQQLIQMLKSGAFELRKWCSNSTEILDAIPPEHRETNSNMHLNATESIKALGLYWQPTDDQFHFKFNFEAPTEELTKRKILATISRLFDPLGWLNPIVIVAKMFLKQLWQLSINWDDKISNELSQEWLNFVQQLHDIEHIKIPRWLKTAEIMKAYELHTFCDGSMKAYSAAIYFRSINNANEISSNLIVAKCRISPMKTITIARME